MRFYGFCSILAIFVISGFSADALAGACQFLAQKAQQTCMPLKKAQEGIPKPEQMRSGSADVSKICQAKTKELTKPVADCKTAITNCAATCNSAAYSSTPEGQSGKKYCGEKPQQPGGLLNKDYLKPGSQALSSMKTCTGTGQRTANAGSEGGGEKKQGGGQPPKFEPPKPGEKKQAAAGQKLPCNRVSPEGLSKRPDCKKPRVYTAQSAERKNVFASPGTTTSFGAIQPLAVDGGVETVSFDEPNVNEWNPEEGYASAAKAVSGSNQFYDRRMAAISRAGSAGYNRYGAIKEATAKPTVAEKPAAIKSGNYWQDIKNGEAVPLEGKQRGPASLKPTREKVFVNGKWQDPKEMPKAVMDAQVEFLRSQNLLGNLEIRMSSRIDKGDICNMFEKVKELKGSMDPGESHLGESMEGKIYNKLKLEGYTGDETGLSMRCNMYM